MKKVILYCGMIFCMVSLVGCSEKHKINQVNQENHKNINQVKNTNNHNQKIKPTNELTENITDTNVKKDNIYTYDKVKDKYTNKKNIKEKQISKPIIKNKNNNNITLNNKKEIDIKNNKINNNIKTNEKENKEIDKDKIKYIEKNKDIYNKDIYNNEKFGFSIEFPSKWKNKYNIIEKEHGIDVYFKTKNSYNKKSNNTGCLFSIIEESYEPEYFDIVCIQRYFCSSKGKFVIGGPTNIDFSPDNEQFEEFKDLKYDIGNVIKTLKTK